jgi:hypothetical protein
MQSRLLGSRMMRRALTTSLGTAEALAGANE